MREVKGTYIVFTPFFPSSKSFRGAYIYDQVKELIDNGLEVVVILLSNNREQQEEVYTYQGLKCYTFCMIDLPSFLFPGLFHRLNMKRLKAFLKKHAIDISADTPIHAHVSYPAGCIAASLKEEFGSLTLLQHHGLDVFQYQTGRLARGPLKYLQKRYLKQLFNQAFKKIDWHIGVSQKVIDALLHEVKENELNTLVLHNGVDRRKFYPLKLEKKGFTIGCIANFWSIKDQMSLLIAYRQLLQHGYKDLKLEFVGSGPTLKQCQAFVQKHKLSNVIFHSEVDHQALNKFYNRLDLFVLPSYYEAFGCVYTEAWASGLPFIAVKGQGIEEVMTERMKSLQLVNPKSPDELVEKISYFYEHPQAVGWDSSLEIQQTIKSLLKVLGND